MLEIVSIITIITGKLQCYLPKCWNTEEDFIPATATVRSRMQGFLASEDHQTVNDSHQTTFQICHMACCGIYAET